MKIGNVCSISASRAPGQEGGQEAHQEGWGKEISPSTDGRSWIPRPALETPLGWG